MSIYSYLDPLPLARDIARAMQILRCERSDIIAKVIGHGLDRLPDWQSLAFIAFMALVKSFRGTWTPQAS